MQLPIEVDIYRCEETRIAAAIFTIHHEDPQARMATITLLHMLVIGGNTFTGHFTSHGNRSSTLLRDYGDFDQLERTLRSVLEYENSPCQIQSVSRYAVTQAELIAAIGIT